MKDKNRLLDPLINVMPNRKLQELAKMLKVSRQSIWKWNNNFNEVSPINQLKINILCLRYNIEPIFNINNCEE